MANRGRGRGKASMSMSSEQLGFGLGDASPSLVLQPPAKYPLLEYKPTPFELTTELSYLLEIKREFAEFIRESPYSVQSVVIKKDIERYSDRYQDMVAAKVSYEHQYDWDKLPKELRPSVRKRGPGKSTKAPEKKKEKKEVDVQKKLEELERKESTQQSNVEEDGKAEEEGEEKDEAEAAEEEETEELDEEMEDDTDYINNYFDNGEGYDDDDDNMDEGPIY